MHHEPELGPDIEAAATDLAPPAPPRRRLGPWAAVGLLLLGGTAGTAWWLTRGATTTPSEPAARAPSDPVAPATDRPEPAATEPPAPLPDVDPQALLRATARAGSASPTLAAWLTEDGLLSRMAAAVRLVAEGRSPRPVLDFLAPTARFAVRYDAAGEPVLDPTGYARYDAVAKVFDEADVDAWAEGYTRLRPFLDRLYAQAGGGRFDDLLVRALDRVRRARVPDAPPRLVASGALYRFADPALERQDEVAKHLMRMGPTNAGRIQRAAARFARAAGLQARADAR